MCNRLLDVGDQIRFVWVAGDAWEGLAVGVVELPCPGLESQSCTSKSSMVSKGSDSAASIVDEEFEI